MEINFLTLKLYASPLRYFNKKAKYIQESIYQVLTLYVIYSC